MTYEGIRTASTIELHQAYRRMIVMANSSDDPMKRAGRVWLGAVCNEINRRWPSESDEVIEYRFGDPGDEIEI